MILSSALVSIAFNLITESFDMEVSHCLWLDNSALWYSKSSFLIRIELHGTLIPGCLGSFLRGELLLTDLKNLILSVCPMLRFDRRALIQVFL